MLPFQKTTIYSQTLIVIHEILQTFKDDKSQTIKQKIEQESFSLTTHMAKAFSQKDTQDRSHYFDRASESLLGIIALLDLAEKNSNIATNQKEELEVKLITLKKNISNFDIKQKKILILSAELGQGHMSAAKAIRDGIQHNYGYDYSVEIVDFQQIISSFINNFTKSTYENWVKFTPSLYKLLYQSTNTNVPIIKLLNQFNYPFVLNKLTKFFREKNPDIVISTFPIWSYLASEIWKKSCKKSTFISIVTDSITIHKSWVLADTDYHIVANNDTASSLHKLGIPHDKIKVLGFPVKLDFMEKINKQDFLKEENLNPKKFTVLFLPTSQQQKKNIKIIHSLAEDDKYNIIVITGRDSRLLPKLEKYTAKSNVKVYGWTDKMPQFMQSSDLIISKAGGATVMECIAAGKPMIITSIIPGQETGNAELIKRYHLGIVADAPKSNIPKDVEFIRKNYKTYIKKYRKTEQTGGSLKRCRLSA